MYESIAIGDFEVHPSLNQVARRGETIRVTPKVMQVLVCLAESAGKVVTRDQLLDAAWPDVAVSEDVLTSAVSELRRIFRDSPKKPSVIETIPKTGYRLIAPVAMGTPQQAERPEEAGAPSEALPRALPEPPKTPRYPAVRWLLPSALAVLALAAALLLPTPWLSSSDAALESGGAAPLPSPSPAVFPELGADDYYRKGREYYLRHNYSGNENAIALFRKSLQADPDFALAYAGLADGYSQRVSNFGMPSHWADLAVENARKAVSLAPGRPEGYKALGLAYANKGLRQKAFQALGKAVQIDPNHFPSVYNLALLHHRTGSLDGAVLWLRKAWELNPSHPLIMSMLGEIHSQLDDYPQAELWFRRALEFEPLEGRHHAGLGTVELLKGKRRGITEGCRQILQKFPNEIYCLIWTGEAELILGNHSQARHAFSKIVQARPYMQYARFRVAQVDWLDGRREKADELLEKVLQAQLEKVNRLEAGGDWSDNWLVAAIHSLRGNREEAFVWLDRTLSSGRTHSGWDSIEPAFANLRADPRFDRYLAALQEKGQAIRNRIREFENPSLAQGRR